MDDAIWSVLWLVSTVATVRTCATTVYRMYPQDSACQRILHTTVLSVSIGIISLTCLGATGLLSRPSLLLAPVVVSWLLRGLRVSPSIHNAGASESGVSVWLWSAVAGLIVGHSLVNGVLTFPVDYDCLMYHLPVLDIWIQTGSFAATASPRWSDSANSEVLGLWFCGAFSGDFFAPLNNLPVMVVWVAGLLEVARQFGVGGWWRHFVALAAIAVYTTVHETDDASNDLMVVAFFVSGLGYALRYQKSQTVGDRLLFGLSLGVLAGTKFFATGYALLLGLVFFWLICAAGGFRKAVRDSVVSVGISLLAGGYWYVRNYVMTGHVFFPKGSAVMRERITHPDLLKTTLAFNGDSQVPALLMDAIWKLCGPIHFVIMLLLPSVLLALVFVVCQRWHRGEKQLQRMLILIVLLLVTGLIALTTPMLVEDQPETLNHLRWAYTPIRYSLCFLTIMVLAVGVLVQMVAQRMPSRIAAMAGMSMVVVAFWQLLVRFYSRTELDVNFAIAVGLMAVILFHLALELWRRSGSAKGILVAILMVAVPVATVNVANRWHAGFASHYDTFYSTDCFRNDLFRAPERILVLDERSYAFFGSARQHDVLHAPNYRDMEDVRHMVQQNAISLIVTRDDRSVQKISRYSPAWTDLDAADDFRRVGAGRDLRLYRPTWPARSEVELNPGQPATKL